MAGEQAPHPDVTATDADLEGLSEADRALVLEAERRLLERQQKPRVSETLERRIESELGVEPEEEAG
jgi:hypothetical protein